MGDREDPLAQAERHVRQAEAHVAQQRAIVARLDRDQHGEAATIAREMLATLEHTLELARAHLRLERAERGLPP